VALKAQAAALAHKSDAGGVIVGIRDATALEAAWTKLHANIARARPELALDGVLVETMAIPGLELMVAARRDPHYGPVLAVGLGGVMVEALGGVRLMAPDLPLELRAAAVLNGWRGLPARDVCAVAGVLALLGRALLAHDDIDEIEINPLVVYQAGQGAVALDALMVLDAGSPDESNNGAGA
jgi:acetate---CoA ligase (ADP-forming)